MEINATFLGQAVAFLIFAVICMKYVWPPLLGAIEKRHKEIADGLDSAEKVSPGFRDSILTGEVKAPKEVIREIRNIPEEKRTAAVEAIKGGNIAGAKEIIKKL